jgi:hypothetical protein
MTRPTSISQITVEEGANYIDAVFSGWGSCYLDTGELF